MLRSLFLALIVGLVPTATAWAQDEPPRTEEASEAHERAPAIVEAPPEQIVRVAGSPRFPGRAELWARRVTRALRRGGASVVEPEHLDWDREGIDEHRLIQLEEIEAALGVARRAQAQLEEAEAMRALSAASRRARDLLDVPGAAEWLAEVEVVTAIVAAQRGESSLAEASLRRALALAPDRALQEGEAPPELVARSIALMREEVRRARMEIRVEGSAATERAAAQIFVDDRPFGSLPRAIEVPAGVHVIRVEARGHRSYARLVDLAPGSRAPMQVALAPSAPSRDADALDRAIEEGTPDAVAATLASIVAHGGLARSVWLVLVGTGPLDRAVLVRCVPGACETPRRIDDTAVLALDAAAPVSVSSRGGVLGAGVLGAGVLAEALAWVDEAPIEPPPPPPSLAEAWWLWTGVGVVAVGLGVGIALGVTPSGDAPLVLRIDPCTSCAR